MAEDEKQAAPLSIYDAVVAMVDQTAAIAWQKLGLQPDVITGKIVQDLAEAKVSIDLTVQLASHIEDRLDESDRIELQNLIRNLRLNYVQKTKEGHGDETGSGS